MVNLSEFGPVIDDQRGVLCIIHELTPLAFIGFTYELLIRLPCLSDITNPI